MSEIPKTIDYSSRYVSVVQLKDTDSIDQSFRCSDPKYTEYYKVHAFNDMKMGIGQTWLLKYKNKVIGFISIAMSHMKPERDKSLEGKGYGNIPALLVGHLATHQDYQKRGVGNKLLVWAIKKAIIYSKVIGCRIVMLNPEDKKELREFYKNRGFKYVPRDGKESDAFIFDIHLKKRIQKKISDRV